MRKICIANGPKATKVEPKEISDFDATSPLLKTLVYPWIDPSRSKSPCHRSKYCHWKGLLDLNTCKAPVLVAKSTPGLHYQKHDECAATLNSNVCAMASYLAEKSQRPELSA